MTFKSYLRKNIKFNTIESHSSRSWFKESEIAQIYGFPTPTTSNVVVAVISLGGGLYGNVTNGILTGGDVQAYWNYLGISSGNMPRVVISQVDGATNVPNINDGGATEENTIDVSTIGALCPSPNLTIIMYIAPNTYNGFLDAFSAAINGTVTVGNVALKPSIISVSWGAPEADWGNSTMQTYDNLFATAVSSNITICVASGDNGSSDGLGGNNVDFPASSPHVVACGGTNLVCPNYTYDNSTTETAWSSGGGGLSKYFSPASFQSNLVHNSFRGVPDVSLDADPNTGIVYIINGQQYIFGGTSVVAPAVSGFLAALNINTFACPLFYAAYANNAGCFHDITVGNNGTYSSGVGYDYVTGLGSINGANLVNALVSTTHVTSISVNPTSVSLNVPITQQITANVLPTNATNKSISWLSANTSVATVSSSGLITSVSLGNTIITAKTVDGNLTANVVVGVTQNPNPVTNISVSPTTANIRVGQTQQITPSLLPSYSSNTTVLWSSANSSVASVNSSGLITAVAIGNTTITATSSSNLTATVATMVTSNIIPVTGITTSPTSANILVGQTQQATTTLTPNNASNTTVLWSTANSSIATVNSSGLIRAVAVGNTIITATTSSNLTANIATRVSPNVVQVSSVSFSSPTYTLAKPGVKLQLTATVLPTNATNQSLTWTSSNVKVATVSSNGLVTGQTIGNANINVTSVSNINANAVCKVRVA